MAKEPVEPAKHLLPYLQRADELQKHDPLVAYYCRLYAMEKGLKIPANERTKTTNSLLVSLMNQLEKDKKSITLSPDDGLHLEGFALNVFAKADKQDRAGRADLSTAKTFYAASIFFEIVNQFGPLQPDLEQKQKYAVWKAADIRKAVKEGRKPVPGPPAGDDDLSLPSAGSDIVFFSNPSYVKFLTLELKSQFGIVVAYADFKYLYDLGPNESMVTSPRSTTDPSLQSPGQFSRQQSMNIPPSPQFRGEVDNQHPPNSPPSPPPHSTTGYSPNDYPPPPTNRTENPTYSHSQLYQHQQSFPQEPPQPGYQSHDGSFQNPPHNYSSQETPSQHPPYNNYSFQETPPPHNYQSFDNSSFSSYPNFQSYPSFTDSSLPSVPSHQPSYYQGTDNNNSFSPPSAGPTNYPSDVPYTSTTGASSSRNGTTSAPAVTTSAQTYQYDPNYVPPPEKIAEAHKAARFAVGALAFDDVSVAVDFLQKSLDLLTNPSSKH
ncbi:hypothetical protein ACFE04_022742 [Oxalis oulophora]